MPTYMDTLNISFFPFKKGCPICGAWLDCVTHAHCELHDMTREEFLERYCRPKASVLISASCTRLDGESVRECILRNVSQDTSKWLNISTIMRSIGISYSATRIALKSLAEDGLIECEIFRVKRGSLIPGAPKGWGEKFYRLKIDRSEEIANVGQQ